MGQPEVSAIMAAYNGEQFIQKAIDSVLANTFTDFELIIVNDASSVTLRRSAKKIAQRIAA